MSTSTIRLLDGATGTELDRAGVDVSLPLWSARAIIDAPVILTSVHAAYLEAGADAITTCTFRTSRHTLAKARMAGRARELTGAAVSIARDARDRVKPGALVLGSVAPLEECYDPSQAPAPDVCAREHSHMIDQLLEDGVDAILIETMGTLREARAAAEAAERAAPGRWMISFCLRGDAPGTLLSGESLDAVLPALDGAEAVGVNCMAAPSMLEQVTWLRARLPETQGLVAYANIGYADDSGLWVNTDAVDPARYAEYAREWIDAGATIVGGCCGTTPETTRAMREVIDAVVGAGSG